MASTPRLPKDETGDQGLFSHAPVLRDRFWTLFETVWRDIPMADLKEMIRFRTARHADCFT
jgi:hypothetical protein